MGSRSERSTRKKAKARYGKKENPVVGNCQGRMEPGNLLGMAGCDGGSSSPDRPPAGPVRTSPRAHFSKDRASAGKPRLSPFSCRPHLKVGATEGASLPEPFQEP